MAKFNKKNIKKSDLEKLSVNELQTLDKLIPETKKSKQKNRDCPPGEVFIHYQCY